MSPRWVPASLEILPPAHTHTNRLVRNATNVRSSFVNAEAMRDANKTQDRYLGTSKQIITTDIRYTIFLNNNILNSTILRSTCACHRVSPDSNYLSEILEGLIIHLLDVNYTTTTISTTSTQGLRVRISNPVPRPKSCCVHTFAPVQGLRVRASNPVPRLKSH